MRNHIAIAVLTLSTLAVAAPGPRDRVYTADQNSNTVSVINPATNTLLGQIKLGDERPDILSPLYKGELNVQGLGFSPDHKTLLAISNGSNAVTFIDTATNKVKGTAYIGRSPHEGFFTADGKEAWVVVRGSNYISVIDPKTFKETRRIETASGPGMVIFNPNGKYAYVCSSFTPVVELIDVAKHKVIKKITVGSPFSPFIQITPDSKEVWLTHKDIGKITRIDASKFEVLSTFETGFITNNVAFAKTAQGTFAYVTVGGENNLKVYTLDTTPKLVTTIPVGALPHGVWPSDDGSRIYVGLENGDAVDVIDTAENKLISRIATGQSPQALVYVSNVAPSNSESRENLTPFNGVTPINVLLHGNGNDGKGLIVVRKVGLIYSLDASLFKLKPEQQYHFYMTGNPLPVAIFETNAKGDASFNVTGSMFEVVPKLNTSMEVGRVLIMEGIRKPNPEKATLLSTPGQQ